MTENYEKAVKHYNLGITYSTQGRLDDAIKEYKMAIKYKPDFAEAHYDLGVDYFQLGRLDDAIREYGLAIKYNPNDVKVRENLLQAKSMKGGLDEYIKGCRGAIKLNPTNPLIHYNIALALDKKGLLDEAIKDYREALRIDPNNEYAHCNLGLILIRKGMLDEAVTELNEALRTNPRSINAHLGLGSALSLKGMFNQAIDEFKEVLKIDPNNIDAHASIKLALREMKRTQVKFKENNSSEKRQSVNEWRCERCKRNVRILRVDIYKTDMGILCAACCMQTGRFHFAKNEFLYPRPLTEEEMAKESQFSLRGLLMAIFLTKWGLLTGIFMFAFVVYVFISQVIRGTSQQAIAGIFYLLLIICLYLISLNYYRNWISRK